MNLKRQENRGGKDKLDSNVDRGLNVQNIKKERDKCDRYNKTVGTWTDTKEQRCWNGKEEFM